MMEVYHMSTPFTYVTIPIPLTVNEQLPPDPAARSQVLELGLRQWHIQQAIELYRNGHGTLAYAAEQAGISIREMIILAYAYGLTPSIDPDWLSEPLTLDQAMDL
jgi:hypothetical protein